MTLTVADRPIFFPLVDLPEDKLEQAIGAVEATLYQAIGRWLPIVEYTETKRLPSGLQSVQLSYLPVIKDRPHTVHVRMKGGDWTPLEPGQFEIKYGRLRIKPKALGMAIREAKITYEAGMNFSTQTQEIYNLKVMLGRILTYQYYYPTKPVPPRFLQGFCKYSARGATCPF
jgi:hypothetical protein